MNDDPLTSTKKQSLWQRAVMWLARCLSFAQKERDPAEIMRYVSERLDAQAKQEALKAWRALADQGMLMTSPEQPEPEELGGRSTQR